MRGLFGIALFLLLLPQISQSAAFYFEVGGGITQLRKNSPFFTATAPATANRGGLVYYSLYHQVLGGDRPIGLQLGLNHRLAMGSTPLPTPESYSFHAPYASLRLQLSKAYLGVGYTPLVFKRISNQGGVDFFRRATGASSLLLEGGLLWAVTPKFSLGLGGASEMVRTADSSGPLTYELFFLMRFYFGFGLKSSGKSSSEFKGWRYPFGRELR